MLFASLLRRFVVFFSPSHTSLRGQISIIVILDEALRVYSKPSSPAYYSHLLLSILRQLVSVAASIYLAQEPSLPSNVLLDIEQA